MPSEVDDSVVLAVLVGTVIVGGVVLLEAVGPVSLPGGAVQLLLFVLLLPWIAIDLRRGDRLRAAGLGLIAVGNLAYLTTAFLAFLGSIAIVLGVLIVLVAIIRSLRDS